LFKLCHKKATFTRKRINDNIKHMFGSKINTDKNRIREILDRHTATLYPSRQEVEKRMEEGKKLKIYYGIDPTGPDIHLGHTVQLLFLKKLIQLGHEIILLIGDFTARIGDPTDKDATRKPLTEKDVNSNMRTYLEQVSKIIPKGLFKVEYNNSWLSKMNFETVIKLASHVTVQQMIVRDMFQERIKNEKPISVHEFLYPLMQGYDSVAMKVDGEVGGNDQTFNMLIGRDLEKEYLGKDKLVFVTKLLVGSSGKKMSKSEGEIIAMSDQPQEIRRKILMIDDLTIQTLFELCTEKSIDWIEQNKDRNPRELKEELADELVKMYHGESAIEESRKPRKITGGATLISTMVIAGLADSNSKGKELINQGAVQVGGSVIKEWDFPIKIGDRLKIGKGIEVEIEKIKTQ